ncbi:MULTISPECIES: HlyD family efflux transporter periplasmic adaptor subunit [unclassified Ruegeria]|uniref:efflux RND transporter periplasmic adaptor subunit n=1 Tax=unclassified Ruegeria TaxID=2625375 RepID=UPI001AD9689D|nr:MULTISPECIES: HlyD family efflux transporter periplasmic adaptor subunit [unclassified Ruegeria]MBO9411609.1 HlyD family efflux transporter periplasmic adaptor subunit [Ruegeria sp. R8_1]MBO9415829.1 HlyD family efflux transporter periplasmic adaptor subunit [Ruegeria sp. R8_2]
MRFLRQSLVGVFLASLTLALLFAAAQIIAGAVQDLLTREDAAPQARERVFAVTVRPAELETVTPYLEAFGEVQSRRRLELRAALGGRVVSLSDDFEDGGSVSAGEVLVELDPADAQSALDRAKSDLLDAQFEERDAERSLLLAQDELKSSETQVELRNRAMKRQQDLLARGVGSVATADDAELAAAAAEQAVLARRIALAQAESRVDQATTLLSRARIALEAAERDLGDMTIHARFGGTLTDVTLVEGRLVSANEKLAELVDPNALEVAFRVSTAQFVRLLDAEGDLINAPVTVSLEVTGTDLSATGRISRDSGSAGEGQTGRLLYARMDNASGFKPGDFVTVTVQEQPLDNVVRLPSSVLDAVGTVLVLGTDDRLEALPVELIRRQGDEVLLRGKGLDGREVVIGRTPLLGAGVRVRPLRIEANAGAEPDLVELSDEQRAQLVAQVEASDKMPKDMKDRVLGQLSEAKVPASLVRRIENRAGG